MPPPLGEELWGLITTGIPEFDFYTKFKLPKLQQGGDQIDKSLFDFYFKHKIEKSKEYIRARDITDQFSANRESARNAENIGNYSQAIQFYEKLIAERYYLTEPHERLIIMYGALKRDDIVLDILKDGIRYFENYREQQVQYVRMLSKKFGIEEFVDGRISSRQKITYYYGIFELYNPYNIVEKWKERLIRLEKKEK